MGIQVSNPNQYAIGLNPNYRINRFGSRINFGNLNSGDSFQNNSPSLLFNENFIKQMISQNPEIKKILSDYKLPEIINMRELMALKDGHCTDTQ